MFSILLVNSIKLFRIRNSIAGRTSLVKIHDHVCRKSEEGLRYGCQRYSNNDGPGLTDQETMTIYLFAMHHQRMADKKDIQKASKVKAIEGLNLHLFGRPAAAFIGPLF